MSRILKDWIPAYLDYTDGTEAPRIMHFWCAVSAIASVLRRRVWIDMTRFQWYPNFYIILVAPPGIISKTTTMDSAIDLVKEIPAIKFGPDVVTWQALVKTFADAQEHFQFGEEFLPMSPITLASGELGNLINPQDREMVNLFISLWDGRRTFDKVTKMSGNDTISAPWINMIGCTTPHWIADNMPRATVGGGFTSRCVFVYGEKKENFIAYPDEHTRPDHDEVRRRLIHDLEWMSTSLVGPAKLTEAARAWGREWYREIWSTNNKRLDDDRLDGYLARKQTHMHKLALVLSVSESDSLEITDLHLQLANKMLEATEVNLDQVFSKIGRSEESMQVDRFLKFIKRYGQVSYVTAYKHIHAHFPDFRDFGGVLDGLMKSGQVKLSYKGTMSPENTMIVYTGD